MKKMVVPILWIVMIFVALYAPIFILAVYSFTDSTMIGTIRQFSLHNYITLFTTQEILHMIWGTVLLALVVAVLSTFLGTLGAVGAFYSGKYTRRFISFANQIPVVNADVVTGFSVCILLMVFFRMDKDTYIPLVVGQTVLCTPFVYLSVMPRLKLLDPDIYEAALDLGCTPSQALRKVILRQLTPAILSGFMMAVTLSLDDYFITTYTKPAVFDTISTYVVNATRGAQTQIKTALWALSTVIFVIVLLVALLAHLLPDRKRRNVAKRNIKMCLLFGVCVLPLLSTGCGRADEDGVTVLRVSSWEEYIDEGDWDEDEVIELGDGVEILGVNSMMEDFEEWYEETYGERVRVEYSTFGTNEELYNQMSLGDRFDLVCPSEYMIMKLMSENRLLCYSEQFYDETDPRNYYVRGVSPYIMNVFENLQIGGETVARYGAGYMWGVLGFVYNPQEVPKEDTRHWKMLLDEKYRKRITMKDSVRDSYIVALAILNEEKLLSPEFMEAADYQQKLSEVMNDTSGETVEQVEEILAKMRKNAYSLETDSGKADLVTGKVVGNLQWSGDGTYTLDQAEEDGIYLSYAVPEEGSNLWFDGWCMMKDGIGGDEKKRQAAEAFVNFVSRPDNAIRNSSYIGYTSVIAGGDSDLLFRYADWCYGAEEDEDTVQYPLGYFFAGEQNANAEEYILEVPAAEVSRQIYAQYPDLATIRRCAVMKNLSEEENKRISQMWTNIRCFDLDWMHL